MDFLYTQAGHFEKSGRHIRINFEKTIKLCKNYL